ncbi:phosphotransferase enzyme family protein [Paucisalibacillus sp. EB02]|uniref:phosphotransferase enzyme family protein n=1 Tax=Paucisalibacillus sp. EB02 TaxID=1347087 RepID=UPI0005AACA93|nr:phosphotransferase [Paucisalibacillus sp. EB02]
MEKVVEAVYNQAIIERFLKVYHLDASYKLLGDFENYVYEVTKEGKPYILRITHSSHRTESEILGEIEWINYLYKHGANVSIIYPSKNNNLVEKQVASDQSIFYACLFSKVIGNPIRSNEEGFNETLFEVWGKEIGKMHRITADYQPEESPRKYWFEDDLFEIEQYVPEESVVIKRTNEIMNTLKELPHDNYGLIHNDVHNGNFFYDGNEIHIFDFDDACYFWNVSDIAIPLYYACFSLFTDETKSVKKTQFANRFMSAFLKGYSKEMNPPKDWEVLLPLFLKVRDVTLYAALNKKIAPEDRDERLIKRMKEIKKRIESNKAIVSIT